MSATKTLTTFALILFTGIGVVALVKRGGGKEEKAGVREAPAPAPAPTPAPAPVAVAIPKMTSSVTLPEADRMEEFFNTGLPKLPIVETLTYSAAVPWKKGRAAWVADYAAYYGTSRHMIARSLNQGPEYDKQNVANGDRFNVFVKDTPVSFHMVVDISRCKAWVYYLDETTNERVLVKSCDVGLGRPNERKMSGLLTPLGTYTLGEKIAVYRPGNVGTYNSENAEMITVFGTRWIPFEGEVEGCTAPSKGLGLHGCPWVCEGGEWHEDLSGLGGYESDGCIRMKTQDMEELFAVIVTKPTTIYLVNDFFEAKLPGKEGDGNTTT